MGDNRVRGKISRIYPSKDRTTIQLSGIPENLKPKNGYFCLAISHPNYNALYSLSLVAAVNGYDILIRTEKEITSSSEAYIVYMFVDW